MDAGTFGTRCGPGVCINEPLKGVRKVVTGSLITSKGGFWKLCRCDLKKMPVLRLCCIDTVSLKNNTI